jgi:hypothetical protein
MLYSEIIAVCSQIQTERKIHRVGRRYSFFMLNLGVTSVSGLELSVGNDVHDPLQLCPHSVCVSCDVVMTNSSHFHTQH